MKTERMTILVTPAQKQTIAAKAKKLNVSAGEVIRRAVESYRHNDEELTLNAIADELDRAVKEARHALKDALMETRRTVEHLKTKAGSNQQRAA
jgi:signal transduction histidine kinase